ncbi:hypothetical protein HYV79_00655 [Candidatus Woesearchaeota archaeon]|nr:hypothetical protein [Candidatus Woesearchaeota archaeon]
MVLFFRRSRSFEKLKQIELGMTSAFVKVREDMGVLYQWIEYLSAQNREFQQQIDKMQRELNLVPKSANEIRLLVDKYYSFDKFFQRLDSVEQRLNDNEQRLRTRENIVREEQPVSRREPQTALEQKVIRRLTHNSKEYIKNMLMSLISKYEKISALQLREIVVEEQGLCSKSSFYRLLDELESESTIQRVSEGKEKVLTFKSATF